jgi:uncharacterized protein (DUF433 family)
MGMQLHFSNPELQTKSSSGYPKPAARSRNWLKTLWLATSTNWSTYARLSTQNIATVAGRFRRCYHNEEGPMKNFDRITVDPAQMGGFPCVRHLRIPVATVLRLLAGGLPEPQILSEYPDLQPDDIRECLRFAAATATERELPLPQPA